MTNVIFNSGFIGLLIWILLFATSTLALALMIRSAYLLRKRHFLPKVDLAEILKGSLQHGNLDIAYEVCRNPKNKSAICGCSVPSSLRHIGKTDRNDRKDNVWKIAHILIEYMGLLCRCALVQPL